MGCAESHRMEMVADRSRQGFHKAYKLTTGMLGQGSYGAVYIAYPKSGRKSEVAVKIQELVKQKDRDVDTGNKLQMEVEIMKKVREERHCVQFIDFYTEGNFAYIVMEKCEHPFPKALENTSPLTVPMLAACFRQMLQGLSNLHTEGIVHRDVKPANFLVNGTIGKDFTVKLCDLGSATMLSRGPGTAIPLWDVCGTVPYSAPEMLSYCGYGTRVDMWSFGVLAYVLLFGQYPYMPRPFTLENMRISIQADRPKVTYKPRSGLIHAHITPSTISFVEAFLNRDPSARTSANKALKMDWLRPARRAKGSSTKLVQEPHMISLESIIRSAKDLGALGIENRSGSTRGTNSKFLNI